MTGTRAVLGTPAERREAREKATGGARYAAEHTPSGCAYGWPVPAAVARGRVKAVDTSAALALPGVLAVITHDNAQRLGQSDDPTLHLLQNDRVPHRGWHVALVVADSLENARAGAAALRVDYETQEHDVLLTADHRGIYTPEKANGGYPAVRERGDFDSAYTAATIRLDAEYRLAALHNHPMEPHAATALWEGGRLTVWDSSQGSGPVRDILAQLFELDRAHITAVSEHVGGGFGSKGTPRPPVVLAAMAARHTGRPVKVSLPRRQLPAVTGHRAPTLHRVRIGAGSDGRITALAHDVVTHTSQVKEFVEQAAVPARVMYVSPAGRTVHRVAALDVPSPSWMRAPGEAPGMYALECAMDELAVATGLDPVELRLRNEPETEPDSGLPFSSRNLTGCLHRGADLFGWRRRDPRPGSTRDGALLLGSGVAAATYPVLVVPCSATARAGRDGVHRIRVNATDMGTGARTVLAQIAADALRVPLESVAIEIGSTDLPEAPLAGGSAGTASWGWAVHKASALLADRLAEHRGELPPEGLTVEADTKEETRTRPAYARHAFGACFTEVQVDTVTGEVGVRRMVGVYAAGRILNARTARSQFIGGMTMGIGMALMEGSTMDERFGDYAECDLASYHVPTCADIRSVEAHWIEEDDPHLNPMGSKGIGEIGIVGTAAAVANAVHHATGIRLRDLPLTPDKVLEALEGATTAGPAGPAGR